MSPAQVLATMESNTDPKRPGILKKASDKPFWGTVTGDGFQVYPILYYYNAFSPVIRGRILCGEDTVVEVSMRLGGPIIFMAVWLGFCAVFALICTAIIIFQSDFRLPLLTPYLMLFFGLGMQNLFFHHGTENVKNTLSVLLADSDRPIQSPSKQHKGRIAFLTGLGIFLMIFGFCGFLLGIGAAGGRVNSGNVLKRPLNEKNGLAVDSSGFIYIGEGESGSIQVYDGSGHFQYAIGFPTGGAGWFAFGLEDDRLHVVTARTDSYFIFDNGKLVYTEEDISYERSVQLQEQYHMSDSNRFESGGMIYRISFLNTVTARDPSTGQIRRIHLNAPVWPFPIFAFWMFAAAGMALLFVLHHGLFLQAMEGKPRLLPGVKRKA